MLVFFCRQESGLCERQGGVGQIHCQETTGCDLNGRQGRRRNDRQKRDQTSVQDAV